MDLYERARQVLPGGSHNPAYARRPHPVYFAGVDGAYVVDVDGRRYLDLRAAQSALPLGNDVAGIHDAIRSQLDRHAFVPGPTVETVELAEQLAARLASVEQVVFTDSGSKATHYAARLARAFTGRPGVAKAVGGYHGSWDAVAVGMPLRYDLDAGAHEPATGTPASAVADTVLYPFNDIAGTVEQLERHADRLACVLVEPVIGDGYIPADPSFLVALRQACDRLGIVLIFDELITFGVGPGGAQGRLGVVPDLTALGKIIGGGLPIGAVGGRRELMNYADPTAPGPTVSLGATFAGHPLAVAAGLAQLALLTPEVYARLDRLGGRFLDGVAEVRRSTGTDVGATGLGNLVHLHWNPEPITDYDTHRRCRHDLLALVTEGLLARGYAAGTLGRCHLSAAMTDDDIDGLCAALCDVVASLTPGAPPRL